MKNIIKVIVLLFALQSNAQKIVPLEDYYKYISTNNIYFKDVNHLFDKFLGTWEYSNEVDYLKIIITKVEKEEDGLLSTGERTNKNIQYYDYINVDYIYKRNGIIVYNLIPTLSGHNPSPSPQSVSSISGGLIDSNYPNEINIFYDEPSITACWRTKTGRLILTFLPDTTQLKWNRTNRPEDLEFGFGPCETGDDSEYQIPANLILNKI